MPVFVTISNFTLFSEVTLTMEVARRTKKEGLKNIFVHTYCAVAENVEYPQTRMALGDSTLGQG
jgi:hypothetical protein